MSKEEAKQWLRSQIDSSIKIQNEKYNEVFHLCYNKNYLRALKLSKITGQPVNKENFKGGVKLFRFNVKYKEFWCYSKIEDYLSKNYTKDSLEYDRLIEEVLHEYEDYKDYNAW